MGAKKIADFEIRPPKAVEAAFPSSMRVALAKVASTAFGSRISKSGSIFNPHLGFKLQVTQ